MLIWSTHKFWQEWVREEDTPPHTFVDSVFVPDPWLCFFPNSSSDWRFCSILLVECWFGPPTNFDRNGFHKWWHINRSQIITLSAANMHRISLALTTTQTLQNLAVSLYRQKRNTLNNFYKRHNRVKLMHDAISKSTCKQICKYDITL